jgi:hypothetical protein
VDFIDKKPEHIIHDLMVCEFYVQLKEHGCKILKFQHRVKIGGVIPDAFVSIKTKDGKLKQFFVEVQRSGSIDMCTDKYKKLYTGGEWKDYVVKDEFPTVLVVSDLKGLTKYKDFKVIKIGTKYKDFSKIILGGA